VWKKEAFRKGGSRVSGGGKKRRGIESKQIKYIFFVHCNTRPEVLYIVAFMGW
jgi:hypothetical protein